MAQVMPIISNSKEEALLSLMERTNYNIVQENGQRMFGPPPDWIGAAPAKGSEVFVGKLPRDLFEDELVPVFEKIGKIFQIRLMMDFSGTNRGFAFVTFTDCEEAKKAVHDLDNYEIRKGKFIGVCKSVDNCRLFVGGIPKTKGREEIMAEMQKITEGAMNVILYPSVVDKAKNRGFAFVEYENHRSAAMARRKLIPGKIQLWGHEIAVDWAEPEPEVDEETMSKVTVLYVRNLMLSTTEEQIRDVFSLEGELKVEKVKKLRDFAFVHFRSREEASQALRSLNNQNLDGINLEVTWAKPADRVNKKNGRSAVNSVVNTYTPIVFGNGYDFISYSAPYGFAPTSNSQISSTNGNMVMPRSSIRGRSRGAAGLRNVRGNGQNFGRGGAMGFRKNSDHHFIDLQPTMEFIPTNPFTLKPARCPYQILIELCQKNNWGEPNFQLMSTVHSENGENIQYFLYKVTIPGLLAQYNTFSPSKICRFMEEAKQYAAEYVLSQLGVTPEGLDSSVTSNGASNGAFSMSSVSAMPTEGLYNPTGRVGFVAQAFEPGFYEQHMY